MAKKWKLKKLAAEKLAAEKLAAAKVVPPPVQQQFVAPMSPPSDYLTGYLTK